MKYISVVDVRAPSSCVNGCLLRQQQGRISRSSFQFLLVPEKRNAVPLNLSLRRLKYRSLAIKAARDQQTYDSQITILADMPLYESPHASFDRYMEDKPRVFRAIVPDNRGAQRLNEEEWRIRMEPIGFLFLTAWPVVNIRLRYKTKGKEYPSGVPTHTSMVLELKITKWDLEGVTEGKNKPSEFRLNMEGVLYPDRKGSKSRIKGHFHMSISFAPPPILALVPPHIHRDVTQLVMKNLAESMQHKVKNNLLADYAKFKKEAPKNLPAP
ncbi:hypothetical protein BC332_06001 [Capsicum chinense]|uniref:Uncharacterized protein n=1 Tax=Capsicum annuum TaxID=4072 RepID=A0A1U8G074_CAPAN|nr:uncharacterized protein LOC107860507 [Capsicum annuum]KAF3648704.1 putative phosphate transporter PHO1 -like protein 9-like [Capsicum annuum]KAF3651405.1 putative phosphate transporter PHO1 -like protein 9-like [Capsicum annuum]PHT91900.1 hypothetical protein T459_07013 [Capsicum annuum]PHU27669.1 hypothetical protein BC332_06001 [Capsicum chinense]